MTQPLVRRVPFADLALQWNAIKADVMPQLEQVFETSSFCLGPAVERFEKSFAEYTGTRNVVGVNSGTSALHLAMLAAGIGSGDKVLVPAHTFVATAWAVVYVGAEPIFCDVEEATGTIDVSDAAKRMQRSVKAIVPVHLYGQPADMRAVMEFAGKHGLIVIEDAAQSHGAKFGERTVGSIGAYGCFSFYPGKNLGAAGEAGAVATNDDAAAERIRSLRNHGQTERYIHAEVGFNYRMEGIQGLILGEKLRRLDAWTNERRYIARRYLDAFGDLPLGLPHQVHHDHVYHVFVVTTPKRDALRAHLAENGIETGLHYPIPLHRQPCFSHLDIDRQSYPVADRFAGECLTLPVFVGMADAQIELVIAAVRNFMARN